MNGAGTGVADPAVDENGFISFGHGHGHGWSLINLTAPPRFGGRSDEMTQARPVPVPVPLPVPEFK